MILNNKSTNPFAFSLSLETEEQKKKVRENSAKGTFDPQYEAPMLHVYVYAGVTGNHQKEILKSKGFVELTQADNPNEGIEIIDENSPIDKVRLTMNVAESVKLPDFDVVEFCTKIGDKATEKNSSTLLKIFSSFRR